MNRLLFCILPLFLLAGCQLDSKQQVVSADKTQVELRAVQTRSFDTSDRKMTVRNVISTLQDLGFVIEKSDEAIGLVSASKSGVQMTVTVRARGAKQVVVRASGQHGIVAISDPQPYQQFFAALEKAMFLAANEVD